VNAPYSGPKGVGDHRRRPRAGTERGPSGADPSRRMSAAGRPWFRREMSDRVGSCEWDMRVKRGRRLKATGHQCYLLWTVETPFCDGRVLSRCQLHRGASAVGGDDRAGDVAGARRSGEGDDACDLFDARGPPERDRRRTLSDSVRPRGLYCALAGGGSRRDGVYADVVSGKFGFPGAGQFRDGGLGGAVGGGAGHARIRPPWS
jgi:hypothetical protein